MRRMEGSAEVSTWVRGLEERGSQLLEQLPWLLRELGRNFPSFCLGAAFSLLVVALAIERSLGYADEARLCRLSLGALHVWGTSSREGLAAL